LESHGNSSNTDISIHVAILDDLGIDNARIESSDTDQKHFISSACQIFPKLKAASFMASETSLRA
jgi:hypothetical protein